jgi:hypothetical protein
MEVTSSMVAIAALVKVLVDAIKDLPHIKPQFIPFLAILVGMVIYPLWTATFTLQMVMTGAYVGGMSIGVNEAVKNMRDIIKSGGQDIKNDSTNAPIK